MVGKRVRDALYVHRTALPMLAPEARARIEAAAKAAPNAGWTVARLSPDHVGLLLYEPFESTAFPALLEAWRVEGSPPRVSHRSYRGSDNPLILHRKEQLCGPETAGRAAWMALTEALVARGLFTDLHRIGRRQAWAARLAAAGVRVEGHTLCPL